MQRRNLKKLAIILIIIMTILTASCGSNSQETASKKGFAVFQENIINPDNIMNTIKEITSSKYDGRLAGTEGNKLTEDYIADYFRKIGLEIPNGLDNYKQSYTQRVRIANGPPVMEITGKDGDILKNFEYPFNFVVSSPAGSMIKGEVSAQAAVINNSEELNTNAGSLKGKIILVPQEARRNLGNSQELFSELTQKEIKGIIYEVNIESDSNLYKHLPISPFAVDPSQYNDKNGPIAVSCESNTFKELQNAADEGLFIHLKIDFQSKEAEVSNIVGSITGTDEKLKNQYIIISAHMDHVGDNKNGSYNPGALDNASGTAAMMEIARIVKESGVKPKKSLLFIAFNGEEEGLNGAYYYASKPVYPISKDNAVVINLDMIGSKAVMPLVLGNYNEMETSLRKDLANYAEELGIQYEKSVESASDHTPFAEMGIDAVTLINLDIQNPAYHTPKDKIESTVDRNRIGEIAKLVLYYIDKKAFK